MNYPLRSRAALLTAFGTPTTVESVDVPQELEAGAILARVLRASVCGTDVHTWLGSGFTADQKNLPSIMGHEMVGEVVAFGDGPQVDSIGQSLAPGDRIVWTHAPCGHCYYCGVGRSPSLCLNRQSYGRVSVNSFPGLTGAFAEYCYVFPTSGRVKVPDEVPDDWAAPSSCALRTVVHLLERVGVVESHESVVVQGTGPLGLFAVAMLHHTGIQHITAVGAPGPRLEIAKAYGASQLISLEEVPDPAARAGLVRDATRGSRGADVVLEMSGAPQAYSEGLELLAPGGRFGVAGQTSSERVPVDPSLVVRKQLTVVGALSAHVGHYWKALEFLKESRGQFDWDAMLTPATGLDGLTQAMQAMRNGVMKPLIDPQA
ncbi:MAG: Threonine dehydrogenase [Nocardioides sp.]|nr:Threonine dehydrogenase [Nocardioides sp.]